MFDWHGWDELLPGIFLIIIIIILIVMFPEWNWVDDQTVRIGGDGRCCI